MNWNDFFYYDESSPSSLRWKVDVKTGKDGRIKIMSAGDVAGCVDNDYRTKIQYWRVGLKSILYSVHRVVWEMFQGTLQDGYIVDHIDGNGLNNSLPNLRAVPHTNNMRNKVMDKRNTSGATGVSLDGNYWRGQCIGLDGKRNRKSFSIKTYGPDEAFRLACEWRAKMIEQLNAEGAGYTERHGKETHEEDCTCGDRARH